MNGFPCELLSPTIAQLLKNVETRLRKNDKAHGIDHVRHVIMNCCAIFSEIKCNQDVVLMAACLHDVVDRQELDNPGESSDRSADEAVTWLLPLGVTPSMIEDVRNCIRTASWEHHIRGGRPANPESYVLRDADLLEAIGARGIARMFAFAGAYRLGLEWTNIDARNPRKLLASTNELEAPFLHFETKLLQVRELMCSEVAKAEAKQRHEFMIAFLCQYEGEFAFAFPAMAARSSSPIDKSSFPTGSRSREASRPTLFDGPLAD